MANLNPGVNIAGANVGYYSESGEAVAACYGFALIRDMGDTVLGPCVAFVMNDIAGDFNGNTIAFVTPIVLYGAPEIDPQAGTLLASVQGVPGALMLPYGIETDKTVLLVRIYNLRDGITLLDKIPFTIAVQAMTGDGQTFAPVPPTPYVPPPLSRNRFRRSPPVDSHQRKTPWALI